MTTVRKKVQTGKDKNKLFRDLMRVDILEDEIAYAKNQLRLHDTGHINTAIGWLDYRIRQLKGTKEND